jgi:hypothetical protein
MLSATRPGLREPDRHDVVLLRQQPRRRELRQGDTLARGQLGQFARQVHPGPGHPSRHGAPTAVHVVGDGSCRDVTVVLVGQDQVIQHEPAPTASQTRPVSRSNESGRGWVPLSCWTTQRTQASTVPAVQRAREVTARVDGMRRRSRRRRRSPISAVDRTPVPAPFGTLMWCIRRWHSMELGTRMGDGRRLAGRAPGSGSVAWRQISMGAEDEAYASEDDFVDTWRRNRA